jgi:hypothetical protein
MFTAISDFVRRRRKALSYGAFGLGAVYAVGKFAQWKLEEFAEKAELQRLAREKYNLILTILIVLIMT